MGRPAVRFIDTNSLVFSLNMHGFMMLCLSPNLREFDGINYVVSKSNLTFTEYQDGVWQPTETLNIHLLVLNFNFNLSKTKK